jgi:hypothetical protein
MAVSTDWWPSSLAHVPKENPWANEHVVVAEIKSFDDGPQPGFRMTFSALVPFDKLNALRPILASLGSAVSTNGPWPIPTDSPYRPQFWVEATEDVRERYEPLVLSWGSHENTVLAPDPGFLMTYGLIPRVVADGTVVWDDLTGPVRDVVRVTAPSVYDFPRCTSASVSISKPYLQDYLSLRQMALVQSFMEQRWSPPDKELEERLGSQAMVDLDSPSRRMRLFRPSGGRELSWPRLRVAVYSRCPGRFQSLAEKTKRKD